MTALSVVDVKPGDFVYIASGLNTEREWGPVANNDIGKIVEVRELEFDGRGRVRAVIVDSPTLSGRAYILALKDIRVMPKTGTFNIKDWLE